MIIKVFVSIFVIFALSRVYLRFKDRAINLLGFVLWNLLWIGIGFVVWLPQVSDILANNVGIARGVDALVYLSIVALFYGMFRIYIKLEFIEREISGLVRGLALKEKKDKMKDSDLHE